MMKYLYLMVDVGAVIIPFIFSFHRQINFHKEFRGALPALLIVALPFIAWDVYFTRIGVWGFNARYLMGYYIGNIPVEEVLFFLFIPFSCLFTYFVFKKKVVGGYRFPADRVMGLILGIILMIVAFLFRDLHYTAWTLFFLGVAISATALFWRRLLTPFLVSYVVLLVPFFITNGILTGTGIAGEVVWYNSNENLGIRVLTIPIEDFFYGMLLILLNVITFELSSAYFVREHGTAIA